MREGGALTNLSMYTGPMSIFIAGAVGSLVRLIVRPPESWRLRLAHVISGALVALFVAPGVVEMWLSKDSIGIQRMVAVAVGVIGASVAEIAVRVVQQRGEGVANSFIDRVTPTKTEKAE